MRQRDMDAALSGGNGSRDSDQKLPDRADGRTKKDLAGFVRTGDVRFGTSAFLLRRGTIFLTHADVANQLHCLH